MKISKKCNRSIYLFIFILTTIFSALLIPGCDNNKPIKIGFAGALTGRNYELGISGRNGAMFAVEEANKRGGVNGRRIELVVRDDMQDPEVAAKVDKELIEHGVVAIVGHMTSQMTKASLPVINEKKILMISPTATSILFEGADDFLIKLFSSSKVMTGILADYSFKNLSLRKISVVYDLSNKTFADEWRLSFKSNFEGLGGRQVSEISFTSSADISFSELTRRIMAVRPDGIMIIANSMDTAAISQQVRKINPNIAILSSPWGMTADILKHGGRSLENMIFSHIYKPDCNTSEYKAFVKAYMERFGREPDFAAIKSYDAVSMIISAVNDAKGTANIRNSILKKRTFKGLQGDFEIDKYGDVTLTPFLITIKENKFVTIQ